MAQVVTQTRLIQATLTTTNTATYFSNAGANYITTITSITLINTNSTTTRTVTAYIAGTASGNILFTIQIYPNGTQIITGLDYILANTDSIYFKQDTGADVNIAVMGVVEELS